MSEDVRKTDREVRREKLDEVASVLDGTPCSKPGWIKRVRRIGGKLQVTVEQVKPETI